MTHEWIRGNTVLNCPCFCMMVTYKRLEMKDDLHSGINGLTLSLTWLCDFCDVPVTRPTETKMSLCACVCSVLVWPDKFQARCNTKITLLMHQHKHNLSNTIQLCTNGCSFVARKLPGTENTTTWRYQGCIADTTECLWMVTEEALCGKLPGLPLPTILSMIDVWASCWVQPCISWGTWKFALLKHLHLLIYRHINLHQRFNKAQLQNTRHSLSLSVLYTNKAHMFHPSFWKWCWISSMAKRKKTKNVFFKNTVTQNFQNVVMLKGLLPHFIFGINK